MIDKHKSTCLTTLLFQIKLALKDFFQTAEICNKYRKPDGKATYRCTIDEVRRMNGQDQNVNAFRIGIKSKEQSQIMQSSEITHFFLSIFFSLIIIKADTGVKKTHLIQRTNCFWGEKVAQAILITMHFYFLHRNTYISEDYNKTC